MTAVVAVGAVLVLAGCGDDKTGSTASSSHTAASSPTAAGPAEVHLALADGSTGVSPSTPLEISVSGGRLATVTVVDASGAAIPGKVSDAPAEGASSSASSASTGAGSSTGGSADGAASERTSSSSASASRAPSSGASSADDRVKVWTPDEALDYGTKYTLTAIARGAADEAKATTTFTTVTPKVQTTPSIGPIDGSTVGVGMPIRVYFDQPVTDKAAVERHLRVTSSTPVDGAWNWFSSTEVHYRPSIYWPAHATVTLAADLYGVNFGNGVWGRKDRTVSFTVGDRHVSVADAATHTLQVYDGDQLVQTFPMSAGNNENPTRNGPHVVTEKNASMVMDSSTFGLAVDAPGGYRADVKWATRISNNGEFVHAAPWSVAQQGHANVSHGCINLSNENAEWFFHFANPGDVVEVKNSIGPTLSSADGDIYDWGVPWSTWKAGSALK